jgi:hypothetical protein
MNGKATHEELNELHRMTVRALLAKLKEPKAPAEWLHVARGILRDNGLCGLAQTDKDRKALQRLYGLLLGQLVHAMEAESPSAAAIAEVRHFLQQQGITKDLGGAIDRAQALRVLGSTALPFTTKH